MSRGGINKVILIGHVGAQPSVAYTPEGVPVTHFNLATTESWVDSQGERHRKTTWLRITCWRRLAEVARAYLKRGSKVYVEGRLSIQESGSGSDRRVWVDIEARDLQLLDPAPNGYGEGKEEDSLLREPPSEEEKEALTEGDSPEELTDDLPF